MVLLRGRYFQKIRETPARLYVAMHDAVGQILYYFLIYRP